MGWKLRAGAGRWLHNFAAFHDAAHFIDGDLNIGERIAFDSDKVAEVTRQD